ncbi:hypothetical protein F5B19DRAFT_487208 [Rostrohypoxylon terebratum]|nr:hypothetical protein F5B19DRAFT_487208 [Rostrohypoxylon terebratum]
MDCGRLKELENAEEELRRRRERGKLAQRAFRKRQRNKASKEKRNDTQMSQRLKAAIDEIVKVARSDDRPELLRAIREAAEASGSHARESGEMGDDGVEEETSHGESSTPCPSSNKDDLITTCTTTSYNRGSTEQTTSQNGNRLDLRLNNQRSNSSGTGMSSERMTPRLDYGLWFDAGRFVRIDDPPRDIVPYLGKGMKTFAGRLFWKCGECLLDLCRKAEAYDNINPLVAREANERIWNMVQHSPPLHNTRYIIALAEARREFRDRGYIESNNPAGEADSAEILHKQVLEDYEKRGGDVAIWLSPTEVENELRRLMSDGLCGRVERVLENWGFNPEGDPLTKMVQSLIHAMSNSFICFGNGPRWRADRVAAMFNGSAQSALA